LISGKVPKRIGNAHPNIVPYQVFPAADGLMIIATGNDNQFAKLCAVLGEPQIAEEASYRANSDRLANREQLITRLSALTARWHRAELLEKLEAGGGSTAPRKAALPGFSDPAGGHHGVADRVDVTSAA